MLGFGLGHGYIVSGLGGLAHGFGLHWAQLIACLVFGLPHVAARLASARLALTGFSHVALGFLAGFGNVPGSCGVSGWLQAASINALAMAVVIRAPAWRPLLNTTATSRRQP